MLKVKLLAYTPDCEKIVASAAKLCYSSSGVEDIMEGLTTEKTNDFLEKLVSMGHESPIEHVTFTFGMEGVSRSLTHQLVRHRLASYSQKSQRYVTEGQFDYIIPPEIEKIPEAKALFLQSMEEDQKIYDELTVILKEKHYKDLIALGKSEKQAKSIAEKRAIEDARYILPNACETVIEVKMNLRSLIHFMNERLCTRAQWEIRQMALLMKKAIEEQYPELAKYLVPKCEIHEGMPFCTEHSTCGRHPKLKVIYDDYTKLQELIYESKNGIITDIDLAQKFWDIFCKEE